MKVARTAVPMTLIACLAFPCVARGQADSTDLPPAGFGSLRQDDVSIAMRLDELEIQVVPLDERVIRLLSPDTYRSLNRLKEMRFREIDAAMSRRGLRIQNLFLVTFFGRKEDARFEPEFLTVTSQNRLFRPLEILPLSPKWSGRQLGQRETASAIYMYEDGIRVLDPMTVSYAARSASTWETTLRLLDAERAAVIARASRGVP